MRWFRWVAGSAAVVVVVLGAGAAFLATLDLNAYKDEIQGSLERATGHRVVIDGPLHIAWSPRLGLAASGVRVANADWGSEPTMATVGEISVGVEAIPLLTGRVEIRRVMLSDVRVLLERDAGGRGNWRRDAGVNNGGGDLPPIRRIELARVTVVWKDAPGAAERVYHVERLSLAGDGPTAPLDALLVAELDGSPLELRGTLPALAEFGRVGATLPVDIAGSIGGTPIRLAARFQAEPGEAGSVRSMRIEAMTASHGAFSVTGAATIDLTGPRPRIDAQLVSDRVDLDRLGGDGGATGDPMDRPLPMALLSIVDGTVKVEVARLVIAPWTVDGFNATATIADGALTVDPLGGSIAGGAVAGRLDLDNRNPPARLALAGTASGVDVGAISRALRGEALIEGRGDAAIDLRARGDTGRTFLGSAEGVARLVILDGTIMNKYWELIAQDLATRFLPFVGEGGSGGLNCLVGRFDIVRGIADASVLMVDGEQVTVGGGGTIELASGSLDLRLVPQPKDPSLLSLATPILIKGTIGNPKPMPDPVGVAVGIGGLAAGAMIGPLGLLLPFVSGGSIEKPCPDAIAAAEARRRPAGATPAREQDKPGGIRGLFDGLRRSME